MLNNSVSSSGNYIGIATALYSFLSLIIGGIAGAVVSILHSKRLARNENKSLIIAISSELVLSFERCTLYYEQAQIEGKISYSALFAFTDANIFSKYASVCNAAKVIAAIINLKADYFQISRHVNEASRFAAGMGIPAIKAEEEPERMQAAFRAQGRALAFFLSSYERVIENTNILLETTQKITPSGIADDLIERFRKGQERKEAVDRKREMKRAEGQTNNPLSS